MKFYQPFGPIIYRDMMSDDFHSYVVDNIPHILEEQNNASSKLIGNIENQWSTRDSDYGMYYIFLKTHIFNYVKKINEIRKSYLVEDSDETELVLSALTENVYPENDLDPCLSFDNIKLDDITFDIGLPWLNIQKPGEFNPIHNHGGILSGILFIQIPDEIEEERRNSEIKFKSAIGLLSFMKDDKLVRVKPKDKGLLLFPSGLLHGVNPFNVDVERVTMSFNVTDIRINGHPFSLLSHQT
tara:strand:+ start:63 stop:785 length:723 start_codon:yes stop_codon:yes gene_type:complete